MIRTRPDGALELDLQAVPRASRDAIGKAHGDRLKIHVKAPPVDGAANLAIVKLLSKTLALPRDAIELVRGQTGKRKTVRIRGLDPGGLATKLGLAPASAALAGLLALSSACTDPREFAITVILPEDSTDLEQADNASLVLLPSNDLYTFAVDGTDFVLELEGEPNASPQQAQLFLADGETLLAWGASSPFNTAGADLGLAIFLGRPGRLSTWPERIENPDPQQLAALALGRGIVLLDSDGDTFLLNEYTLAVEAGASLDDPAHAARSTDGGLFGAANGQLVRLVYEEGAALAWLFDPGANTWTSLGLSGAGTLDARPGAVTLLSPDRSQLWLFGGGERTDVARLDLGSYEAELVPAFTLDHPRADGSAVWLGGSEDPTADALVVGGGDEDGPLDGALAVRLGDGASVGSAAVPWRHLACALQQDPLSDPDLDPLVDPTRILCVGGQAADATADAVTIDLLPDQSLESELLTDFLPLPIPDPILLEDDFALYAQGEGQWIVIDRASGASSEPSSPALRARGGHSVSLATGATFLVGGVGIDEVALDRWEVFTPNVEP